ncbi:ATPase [Prosthecochloris sp. ZM]|uniref:ABC transporter ATP-binding protein n=1 Tax=Prosthecochloris sp. ZM TaxID=2283143 RepID=UPI000DF76DA4|nr:ABC transporter ATP-binding protein [Prosthecochloris sp. ZM]RDD30323.1 ATPase [Prosthecochloris sp. ZM]
MAEPSVVIEHVSKKFGEITALQDVSFQVFHGEIFGLIGADGAGKTTLMRILTTLILPDSGQATINGRDIVSAYRSIRARIGYMPGRFSLYPDLSVEENLLFFASVFSTTIEENYDLVKDIYQQLEPFKKRRAGKLSGGMKQKLALSCALIHKPEVLFLDEPTTGVDAVSRMEFWQMLKRLKEQNITILVSTPYMDEAGLCDRIGMMQKGKLLAVDTPDEITELVPMQLFAIRVDQMHRLTEALRSYPYSASAYAFGQVVHYRDRRKHPNEHELKEFLKVQGFSAVMIRRINPGIEDTFIALMEQEDGTHDKL